MDTGREISQSELGATLEFALLEVTDDGYDIVCRTADFPIDAFQGLYGDQRLLYVTGGVWLIAQRDQSALRVSKSFRPRLDDYRRPVFSRQYCSATPGLDVSAAINSLLGPGSPIDPDQCSARLGALSNEPLHVEASPVEPLVNGEHYYLVVQQDPFKVQEAFLSVVVLAALGLRFEVLITPTLPDMSAVILPFRVVTVEELRRMIEPRVLAEMAPLHPGIPQLPVTNERLETPPCQNIAPNDVLRQPAVTDQTREPPITAPASAPASSASTAEHLVVPVTNTEWRRYAVEANRLVRESASMWRRLLGSPEQGVDPTLLDVERLVQASQLSRRHSNHVRFLMEFHLARLRKHATPKRSSLLDLRKRADELFPAALLTELGRLGEFAVWASEFTTSDQSLRNELLLTCCFISEHLFGRYQHRKGDPAPRGDY
jgi:hypothetical protein